MERVEATTGTATVTDYRRKVNGAANPNYGKETVVTYNVDAFSIVSTWDEVTKEFSEKSLISMAQSRQKATENSSARQKAVAEYAPSGDDLARENMIKGFMAYKKVSREEAELHVDATLA